MDGITLESAFERIAPLIEADTATLLAYAAEDTIGGWDRGAGEWTMGSCWSVEGQFLYAMTRHLKPKNALEVGVFEGCSSMHILAAMNANGYGQLTSVDILQGVGQRARELYPKLATRWRVVTHDALTFTDTRRFDMAFEDGLHTYEFTRDALTQIRPLLKPGALLVSHDAEHYVVGEFVRQAWADVIGGYDRALIAPSDCGLAWARL